jgi:hypothetical protein
LRTQLSITSGVVPTIQAGDRKLTETARPADAPKDRVSPTFWLGSILALVPILTVVIGGLWNLGKYLDDRAITERRAQITRLIEVQKPFLDQQTKLYFETARIIGDLMTLERFSEQPSGWADREHRFWALYYSELAMVEHCEVDTAMAQFGDELKRYAKLKKEDRLDKSELGQRAIRVAHALRTGMTASWTGQIMGACGTTARTISPDSR